MNYAPILGKFEFIKEAIVFKGGRTKWKGKDGNKSEIIALSGLLMTDQYFTEGSIQAVVSFSKISDRSMWEAVFFYDPKSRITFSAGISVGTSYFVRAWDGKEYRSYGASGEPGLLKPNVKYRLTVDIQGSRVRLKVNGVDVISVELPVALPTGQCGISCLDFTDIETSKFQVETNRPKAFVAMQFSSPYNELYQEVIQSVCGKLSLDVIRIDEVPGPGMVISDITQAIVSAKVVIAEISETNPNVYYEVGFAHARDKPTILLAAKNTKLPFDVSPFRTIFYENSIGGKRYLELELEKNLKAVLKNIRATV